MNKWMNEFQIIKCHEENKISEDTEGDRVWWGQWKVESFVF